MIIIRPLQREDREPLRTMIEKTGVFTPEEIDVAMEVIDAAMDNAEHSGYDAWCAVDGDRVVGYYCIGQRLLTNGTFDLYWIVVDPSNHHRGIGKKLLQHAEVCVKSLGGRLLIAETSSKSSYDNTRKFYLRNQYSELARIKDFYRIGDDLVIYGKYVSQSGGT